MAMTDEERSSLYDLIENKKFKRLKEELCDMNEVDIADLIGELSVAIGRGMTLEEVANIIHPHPSFAEAIMEAARL